MKSSTERELLQLNSSIVRLHNNQLDKTKARSWRGPDYMGRLTNEVFTKTTLAARLNPAQSV